MINLDEIEARANAATPGPWLPPVPRERGPGCDDRACVVDHEGCAVWPWHRREDMEFAYAARTDVPALIARVRELEEQLLTAEERLEQRTRERDHERATIAGVLACGGSTYSEGEVALRAQAAEAQQLAKQMMDERDDECIALRAECERLRTFAAQNFSAMIRQEAEQMREYGLSYEGVRKVLREHDDGEISFGKLMELIRAAARAMAEDMRE